MPKTNTRKFYAVLVGKDGPCIYDTWDEFHAATANFSAFSAKSFLRRDDAQKWIDSAGLPKPKRQKKSIGGGSGFSPRPCYPNSVTFWTEYISPLNNRKQSFYVDTSGVPHPNDISSVPLHSLTDSGEQPQSAVASPILEPRCVEPPEIQEIKLSPEQQRVLEMVKRGDNVFFTGPAGTGKSVLLREIIKFFRPNSMTLSPSLAITASTGIAGLNIGGSTVHSFAGIGLGKEPEEDLVERIRGSKRLSMRWKETSTLIIDEISMLDGQLFDKLEHIARAIRDPEKPFGGIQLVLSGDFCQLPPVPDRSNDHSMPATFAFDAKSWSRCISTPILLSQVFRQKDNDFVDILSAMRVGSLAPHHIERLQNLSRPLVYPDGIEPSELYPLRSEVERCNNVRLDALEGSSHTYLSMDSAGYDVRDRLIPDAIAASLLDRLVAPPSITLKVGAQVMLIRNVVQGSLVNGSVGRIIKFLTTRQAMEHSIEIAKLEIKQGRGHADNAGKTPNPGPVLPDIKPAPELQLRPINDAVFGRHQAWPLVQFTNGKKLLCAPLDFSVEGFLGNVEAHRLQVPLILAWALSIHKSQGQTLTRVKVDLRRIFEKGQAYVALSRATTMEALEVQNFHPSKVQAHPRVLAWQAEWMSQNDISHDEMDSEEAISRYWDLSQCSAALPP